jgi:solute carrier family 45, member 1/2/4
MLIFALVNLSTSTILPNFVGKATTKSNGQTLIGAFIAKHPLNLRNTWTLTQLLFGICMTGAALVRRVSLIRIFISIMGISWACTIWIPFALISTAISARNTRSYMDSFEGPRRLEPATVLALHNVAISAPQVLAALLSIVIFWMTGNKGNGLSVVLGIAGMSGLAASWVSRRLSPSMEPEAREDHDEAILLVSQAEAGSASNDV